MTDQGKPPAAKTGTLSWILNTLAKAKKHKGRKKREEDHDHHRD